MTTETITSSSGRTEQLAVFINPDDASALIGGEQGLERGLSTGRIRRRLRHFIFLGSGAIVTAGISMAVLSVATSLAGISIYGNPMTVSKILLASATTAIFSVCAGCVYLMVKALLAMDNDFDID